MIRATVSLHDFGSAIVPVAYSYDNANRLLSAISDVETNEYWYNGAGRLTNQVVNVQSRSCAYSFRSQMVSLTDTNSSTRTYSFDGDGNRSVEVMPGPDLKYVYDGPNVVLEVDNINSMYAAYVNGPGIDQPIELGSVEAAGSDLIIRHLRCE
jgi:YD repeat-containing protein